MATSWINDLTEDEVIDLIGKVGWCCTYTEEHDFPLEWRRIREMQLERFDGCRSPYRPKRIKIKQH